jgi:hypothetical protein
MTLNAPFKPLVVESLSVRVVVDSVFDQFMPKVTHPMVTIEHVGRIRSNLNSTLAGEWGLSLCLESRNAGATGRYLLDFGYTSEVLLRNFGPLGLEAERLDGLILSHGHRAHYGGLPGFSPIIATACAPTCSSSQAARRHFARNGSARATRSRCPGARSTGRCSKRQGSRHSAAIRRMPWRARLRPATSRAIPSSGSCPTRLSSRPRPITSSRRSGAAGCSPIGILTSTPPATSCKDAGSWSSRPAAIAAC